MSLPVREVGLEEGSILNLIGDYFEVAGHAECLLAVEHLCSSGSSDQDALPLELAVLREIVLAGRWDQLAKYLDRFASAEDQEGLKRCMYLAHKQKYLEILQHVESDIQARIRLGFSYCENGELLSVGEAEKVRHVVEAQLATLEPFCPSRDDYNSLKMLLSLPSISSSKEFSSWQVHSGRLATMQDIQEWVSNALYLNVKLLSRKASIQAGSQEATSSCTLLRLLAKGLLYEQCERLCRARCGEADSQQLISNMLDLRGWIQQQPDSSFQLPPAELCLMVSPWVRPGPPSLQTSQSVDMGAGNRDSGMELRHDAASAKSVSCILPLHNSKVPSAEDTLPPVINNQPNSGPEEDTSHPATNTPPAGDNAVDSRQEEHVADLHGAEEDKELVENRKIMMKDMTNQTTQLQPVVSRQHNKLEVSAPPVPAVSAIPDTTSPNARVASHVPGQSSVQEGHGTRARESRGAMQDHTPPSYSEPDIGLHLAPTKGFLPSTTPLHKAGRGSSTPKNVKVFRASLKTSPPSSPIMSNLQSIAASAKVDRQGARKRIDFHSGPTVTLLSTITDSQAVRSVAFSESGKMMAVGANSGTLRLFDTASLLENKNRESVDVLYQNTRFHRGSIYCIAWYGDTMLASGSNDKTVSLLTVSSDSGTSELSFKTKRPFPFNKGTIRDVVFTRDGLLVHGGGVSPEIHVMDIRTCQSQVSLLGHTDQVLTLDILPGGLLASGGQDKMVLLWDTRSQQPVSTLVAESAVASMTSSGNRLVTSHLDGSCAVYDLNTFKRVSTYSAHTQECRSVRYQPKTRQRLTDKTWVLSGSYDKTVCLTNTEDLQWTRLCRHEDKVIQCRWHPEGKLFASTGADKKACIWSIGP